MAKFRIQDVELEAAPGPIAETSAGAGLHVSSIPRPYKVDFLSGGNVADSIVSIIEEARSPLLMIDRRVRELHFRDHPGLARVPIHEIDAREQVKTIEGSLEVCKFLQAHNANKGTTFFVIGGGITQDVGGFAAGIYKRGTPWVYVPTTLLAQGDSGIGSKTGLNFLDTKNILAMFSAPRRVIVHTAFLDTLPEADLLSGLGEIFRLHITGGPDFLDYYERRFADYLAGAPGAIDDLIASALSAKRAIIERDEFETDLRRAMNYGHSTGHAFEVLSKYTIPHGTGVVIGMLIENHISMARGILQPDQHARILKGALPLLSAETRRQLAQLNLEGVVDLLARDKKVEGGNLKLVVLERIGQIRFIDLPLAPATADLLADCLKAVLKELT